MMTVKEAAPILFVLLHAKPKTYATILHDKPLFDLVIKALIEIAHNIPICKTLTKNLSISGKSKIAKRHALLKNRKKVKKAIENVLKRLESEEI